MTERMQLVATVFEVKIKVFNDGRAAPNFFAFYRDKMGQFDMETLVMIDGDLPEATVTLVTEWAENNRDELWDAWESPF